MASLREAFFERSGLAFTDFPLDLLRERFTLSTRGKIPFHFLIPRRFLHPFKPAGELPALLFWQMLSRLLKKSFGTDSLTVAAR